MRNNGEPKLCSECPLTKAYRDEALRRIRDRQLINNGDEPSALKVCIERRKILSELGLSCPYFQYGFNYKPPEPPTPQPQPKTERQTPILMFTEKHRKGNSWNCEGKLFCPDKQNK